MSQARSVRLRGAEGRPGTGQHAPKVERQNLLCSGAAFHVARRILHGSAQALALSKGKLGARRLRLA